MVVIELKAEDEDDEDSLVFDLENNETDFEEVSEGKYEWETDYESSGNYELKVSVSDKTVEQIAGLSSTSVGDVVEIENYSVAESDFLYLYTLRPNDSDVRKIAKYPSGGFSM